MARFVLTLLCVLFLGQTLAFAAVTSPQACAVTCADDTAAGICEPTCSDCGCCVHGAQPLLAPLAGALGAAPVRRDARCADDARAPSADARDVFHVPLARLV
jgi:hypothetical protein